MSARKILKAFQLTAVAFVAALLVVDVAWAQQRSYMEARDKPQQKIHKKSQ